MSSTSPFRGAASLARGLELMEALCEGAAPVALSQAASRLNMAASTARRMASVLERRGYVARAGRGAYIGGPALVDLAGRASRRHVLAALARPFARRLALRLGATVHLGVFEDDMITYVVKEGAGDGDLFTREGLQLEAYCTAIGKMLVASLPAAAREHYLNSGPFVALTDRTITDPETLRLQLAAARAGGFATEHGESAPGLSCMAVPVAGGAEMPLAAISASWRAPRAEPPALKRRLEACSAAISAALRRASSPASSA